MEDETMQVTKEEMDRLSRPNTKKGSTQDNNQKEEDSVKSLQNLLANHHENIIILHNRLVELEKNNVGEKLDKIASLLEQRIAVAKELLEVAKKDIEMQKPGQTQPVQQNHMEENPQNPF